MECDASAATSAAGTSSGGTCALPSLSLSTALESPSALDEILARHGFCILHGLTTLESATLDACDAAAMALFSCPARRKGRLRAPRQRASTRLHSRCTTLPLAGLGLHNVHCTATGALLREQFHSLADESALELVPWPTGRGGAGVRPAVRSATALLHGLCTRLLDRLDPRIEGERELQQASLSHSKSLTHTPFVS